MAILMPNGKQAFVNDAGQPLSGGKLYTYSAGTMTPRTTWTDASETTPNTNPIILNARGEATIFWRGAYKVALTTATDVPIWTIDGVTTAPDTSSITTLAVSGTTTLTGAVTMGGALAVTGAATFSSTVAVTGNATVGGTLAVTGVSTFTGNVTATNNLTVGGALAVTGNLTVAQITATRLIVNGAAYTPSVAIAASGTTTINCQSSNVFRISMGTNITTLTISNAADGQTINVRFVQDGTGSRTVAWPASFKWAAASVQTLSTAAGAVDLLVATYYADTGFWYVGLTKGLA
jgi:cytoskeletal protein CcmA (bactofilin family)